MLLVQDLKHAISKFWFAHDAKDVELIAIHNDVVQLKKVISRLESKEGELQGTLSASQKVEKELDEIHNARIDLIEENMQLKSEKSSLEVVLT